MSMEYINLLISFPWPDSRQRTRAYSLSRLHDRTQTQHTRQDSSGRVISPSQRPYLTTQQSPEIFIPPRGFEPVIPASERPLRFNLRISHTGMLISPQPDQEGNKLQRQKILSFIYPICNPNWRNISTIYIYIYIYIYITRLT